MFSACWKCFAKTEIRIAVANYQVFPKGNKSQRFRNTFSSTVCTALQNATSFRGRKAKTQDFPGFAES